MSKLFDRIYGCEAAGTIANSMGDVTEGLYWFQIEERYGYVETLLAQDKKGGRSAQTYGPDFVYHPHHRPPGMTEDGHERHRLCTSAILKKGGRITIDDLARTWAEDIDPEKFGYLLGPQDRIIYEQIHAGVPPYEVGKNAAWPGFIGTTKMIQPVGMVNACNPPQAAQDAFDLGRIKDTRGQKGNYALEVCAGVAAATAEALKPGATVQSIIDTALSYLTLIPRKEAEKGLDWAREVSNWKDLRPKFHDAYLGKPMSNAVEILTEALCCFLLADGDPKQAILMAVNFGRDTDCKAYIAGGLSGALRGISAVPQDWVRTIESEVAGDPYTISRRTARESAEGLCQAALAEMRRLKGVVAALESQIDGD